MKVGDKVTFDFAGSEEKGEIVGFYQKHGFDFIHVKGDDGLTYPIPEKSKKEYKLKIDKL